MNISSSTCKICGSQHLKVFAHTASCQSCGVLLCYPYPKSDTELFDSGVGRDGKRDPEESRNIKLQWHLMSGDRNHSNFTNMIQYALDDCRRYKEMSVLDYGGGGGQFALVLRSLFPLTTTHIVDISDDYLLHQFQSLNAQIKYRDFESDATIFDYIFMNDVFEHLSDPVGVLKSLKAKLANPGGGVFIDTPCQFWLYPVTKVLSKTIHRKLLRGTVDHDHQQIWSRKSFYHAVDLAGFTVDAYSEVSEYTQPADFYLKNMGITNPLIKFCGKVFYRLAPILARNKILAVLKPK